MRKSADRRRVHHGSRTPVSVAAATAAIETPNGHDRTERTSGRSARARPALDDGLDGGVAVTGEGPFVVRQKTHRADPMSLDQALYEMELVGHDFYLFVDGETSQPCVVYRRHGYDYGVIRLQT